MRARRRLLTFLGLWALVAAPAVAPAVASAAAAGPSAPPAGTLGIRLLDAPVAAGDDPRARLYIVDHLAPGTTIHRRIEVITGTAPTKGVLYAAAAAVTNGSFVGAAGRTVNELSSWTGVTPPQIDLGARGRMTATVTIAIPRDAAPGERYGVVWAETRSAPAPGGGVVDVSRVGIRLYLSVGPGGAPAADFKIESLTARRTAGGQPMVVARVRNTGGRALDMSGALTLRDGPGGLQAGPFRASLGTTLPIGGVEPVGIPLDSQLPAGPWDARLTLRSGLVERGSQAKITFPGTGAPLEVTSKSSYPPTWPTLIVCLAVMLVALALLIANGKMAKARKLAGIAAPALT